jgi:hypothetical protein
MKASNWIHFGFAVCALPLALAACGGEAEVPPQGAAALKSWLANGSYKTWHCEPQKHAARAPSPHDYNRICSNSAISDNDEDEPYPKGAAAVKELWGHDGAKVIGYAVYIKVQEDSAEGAGWYFYEENPELKADGPVADDLGNAGMASTLCVGCHSAAGKDAAHSGHDFVYTQVE